MSGAVASLKTWRGWEMCPDPSWIAQLHKLRIPRGIFLSPTCLPRPSTDSEKVPGSPQHFPARREFDGRNSSMPMLHKSSNVKRGHFEVLCYPDRVEICGPPCPSGGPANQGGCCVRLVLSHPGPLLRERERGGREKRHAFMPLAVSLLPVCKTDRVVSLFSSFQAPPPVE